MKRILLAGERYGLFFALVFLTSTSHGELIKTVPEINFATDTIENNQTKIDKSQFNLLRVKSRYGDKPLEGVRFYIKGNNVSYYSDSEGKVYLPKKEGKVEWLIENFGYSPTSIVVSDNVLSNRWISMLPHIENSPEVAIGDVLPNKVLDYKFNVYHPNINRSLISLRELQKPNQLTVIVFWATYCAPCIEVLKKWEESSAHDERINVINVMMDLTYKDISSISKFNLKSYLISGDDVAIINKFFFKSITAGPAVMIYNGILADIPKGGGFDESKLQQIFNGKVGVFEVYDETKVYRKPSNQ